MPARKLRPSTMLGSFLAFIAMSAVAGILVTAAVTPVVAMTAIATQDSIGLFDALPSSFKIDALALQSTIYATNDKKQNIPIATFYSQNRIEDTLTQISPLLQQAAIDTEDPRFYQHGAIDIQGTIRAAISNILHKGGTIQGGSSITQQYVKNVRVNSCEQYNITATATNSQTQEQAQAALDKQYQDCYYGFIAATTQRKIEEAKLAITVEQQYTKDQILQGYLNISLFGGQVYGVEAAARYYFGTTAAKVNLQQAATLVAILNNPNLLRIDQDTVVKDSKGTIVFSNTKANGFTQTLTRRNYVIDQMLKEGSITQAQHDAAVKTKIVRKLTEQPSGCAAAAKYDAAFYCQAVLATLQNNVAFGATADARTAQLRQGGLKIYTPLNLDLQAKAQAAISNYFPPSSPYLDLGAGNVAVELNTGRVVEMVQNRPFGTPASSSYAPADLSKHDATQVNYDVDADLGGTTGFQTGSTYKLFTLIEWLKQGHSINDIIGAPYTQHTYPQSEFHSSCPANVQGPDPAGIWQVGNDVAGEGGPLSILQATRQSVNTAFAQMATSLDLCNIRQDAIDLGVHLAYPYTFTNPPEPRTLRANPASVLGTNELAPLTLASAYGAVANSGVYCNSIFIDKVVDASGKSLPVPQPDCRQKLDKNIAAGVITALKTPLQGGGTGAAANPNDGVPIIGKTGTTDNASQVWLVSSTTKVAQATWVGNVQARYATGCTSDQIAKSTPGCTTPYYANTRYAPVNYTSAAQARLYAAKVIIAALNKDYGGAAFPAPTGSVLVSNNKPTPDLTGKTLDQAQAILKADGFDYTKGADVSSYQPAGTVAGTLPPAGTSLAAGSNVTVLVSRGDLVQLPNLVGMTVANATAAILAIQEIPVNGTAGMQPDWIVTSQTPTPADRPAGMRPGYHIKITATPPPTSATTPPATPTTAPTSPAPPSASPTTTQSRHQKNSKP
ncbi:transglycosylase domain-containing protein [Gryllotalpicola sp.]|uniref:transglycosylase domain-containing protein n=1 Tax=Gryllotalpicola sp. TaxID=1932787 RepID=UPI00262F059E|nr:transglycosylase domain-containing protein [Gryllotalpicola sp.]